MSYCLSRLFLRRENSSRNLQSSPRIMINEFLALLLLLLFLLIWAFAHRRDSFNDNASPFNFNSRALSMCVVLIVSSCFNNTKRAPQLHHSQIIHRISEAPREQARRVRTAERNDIYEKISVSLHNRKLLSISLLYYISINF